MDQFVQCGVLLGLAGITGWYLGGRTTGDVGRRLASLAKGGEPPSLVVITGAGSGIGREVAKLFATAGYHLILVGRTLSTLEETSTLVDQNRTRNGRKRDTIGTSYCCACDITSEKEVDATLLPLVHALLKQYNLPRVSYLVLNAGSGAIVPFVDSDWTLFDKTGRSLMELNYFANVRLLHRLLPLMTSSRSSSAAASTSTSTSTTAASLPSRVLIISSLAGVLPSTLRSAYTASKHAMQGFIHALRGEYRPGQVTFTLACPGYVETEFHSKASAAAAPREGSTASSHRKGCMSAATCAVLSVEAMVIGQPELVMTTSGSLAYLLRPWMPRLIDRLAAKKSYASVGLQPPG